MKKNGVATEETLKERTESNIVMNYSSLLLFGTIVLGVSSVGLCTPYTFFNKGLCLLLLGVGLIFVLGSSFVYIRFLNRKDMKEEREKIARFRRKEWIRICDEKLADYRKNNEKNAFSNERFYKNLILYHKPISWHRLICYAIQIAVIILGVLKPIDLGGSQQAKIILIIIIIILNFVVNYMSDGWTKDYWYDEFAKVIKKELDC